MTTRKHKPIHPGQVLKHDFLEPMGLQSQYDLDIAEDAAGKQIARQVRPLKAA